MHHYHHNLAHCITELHPTLIYVINPTLSHLLHGKPQVEYFCVPLEHVVRRHDAHKVHALLLRALQGPNSIEISFSVKNYNTK